MRTQVRKWVIGEVEFMNGFKISDDGRPSHMYLLVSNLPERSIFATLSLLRQRRS